MPPGAVRLLVINPNTTVSITHRMIAVAAKAVQPHTHLIALNGRFGARYITSRATAAIAGHAALDALAHCRKPHDAVVLACFGDPGLLALRELSSRPVIGMAEASIRQACRRGRRFAIVTGGERWKPMLKELVMLLGFSAQLAAIRAVAVTGEDIARDPESAYASLSRVCRAAARDDGADVVILGGAGLAGLAETIQPQVPVPLIDSTVEAVRQAERQARSWTSRRADANTKRAAPVRSIGLSAELARILRSGR